MSDRDEEFGEFMRNRASLLHQSAYLLCGDWHLAHDTPGDRAVARLGQVQASRQQGDQRHSAIGLRGPWVRGGYRELWVDAQTFLPLRTIVKGPGNLTRVDNETWLPRTKSLLDMVNHVHIPGGFRQVAPPR